jgi:hypothetical protein
MGSQRALAPFLDSRFFIAAITPQNPKTSWLQKHRLKLIAFTEQFFPLHRYLPKVVPHGKTRKEVRTKAFQPHLTGEMNDTTNFPDFNKGDDGHE